MNFYPRHIGDYLKDCGHLTLLEHGVYSRLLDLYYSQEAGFDPAQVEIISRKIGARTDIEREAVSIILSEFFYPNEAGLLINRRVEAELQKYRKLCESQKARIRKRYNKSTDGTPSEEKTTGKPTETVPKPTDGSHAEYQPLTINQEPIVLPSVIHPRVTRNIPLPENWSPNETHKKLAVEQGKDLNDQAELFKAYHLARENKFKNWDQAFSAWLRTHFKQKNYDHRAEKRNREFIEQFDVPEI